jgi:glycosyltransferase involved in cell wall biosynthesis
VVFDFLHSVVLAPAQLAVPSLLFTHNVEFEIFERHAKVARGASRLVWKNQARKMRTLEKAALRRFDRVVAVSERDGEQFVQLEAEANVEVIPTGVDLDFFEWRDPATSERVVFTGALDWPANEDGIHWLLSEVWPEVEKARPEAELVVIGRNPSRRLSELALQHRCSLTGWVEDVREHVAGAGAFVIPLRVGGGTRIKGYEACAAGPALVSTSIGVEGLSLEAGLHYRRADTAEEFVRKLIELLSDRHARSALSQRARQHVEENCSFENVARRFSEICKRAIG